MTTLLKAFKEFKKKEQSEVKLVLVGDFDSKTRNSNLNDLLSQIENHPYSADIIRVGFISNHDLSALLQGSIALVHPSLFEGFGLTIREAMKLKVPVIASNTTSIPEL